MSSIAKETKGTGFEESALHGSVLKKTISIGMPILLGLVFQALYQLTDQYFIISIDKTSRYLPGIIQVISPIAFIITFIGMAMTTGVTAIMSRAIGRKDTDYLRNVMSHGFILSLITSAIFVAAFFFFAKPILTVAGARENLLDLAKPYFMIFIISIPFQFLSACLNGFFQGKGNTKPVFYSQLIGNIVNMIFTPLLIFGVGFFPELGIWGAALATTIGQFVRLLIVLIIFLRNIFRNMSMYLNFRNICRKYFMDIVKNGFPMIVATLVISVSQFVINNVLSHIDEGALGAIGTVGRISSFAVLPATAIAISVITLVGQNYGAQNKVELQATIRLNIKISFVLMTSIGLILFFLAKPIIGALTKNQYVEMLAVNYIRIEALSYGFLAIEMLTRQSLLGMGYRKNAIFQVILRFFCVYVPSGLLLVFIFKWGANGVWISTFLSNFIGGLFGYIQMMRILKIEGINFKLFGK